MLRNLASLSIVLLLVVLVTPAEAQTPTACSPPAGTVGKDPATGKLYPCGLPGADNQCTGRFVAREGHWAVCQPWVPVEGGDPYMDKPADWGKQGCGDQTRYERWTDPKTGLTCSSQPPGSTRNIPLTLKARPHGQSSNVQDAWGPARGWYSAMCVDGEWDRPKTGLCRAAR